MEREDKKKVGRFQTVEEFDLPKKSAVEEKAEAIRKSKMPESQKAAYLEQIGATPKAEQKGIPFAVYAKIKKISKYHMSAMLAYPKAKGISLATLKEWEEIFKDF